VADPKAPTEKQVDAALGTLRDLVRRALVAALNVEPEPADPAPIHPLARPTDGNTL
jgi:hypothetical protein